jgi:LysM repeat protein
VAAERYVLSVALLVPLAVAAISVGQLASTGFAGPSLSPGSSSTDLQLKRPALVQVQAPPTLAPPTPTPRPTATIAPSPTPRAKTYVVEPGDELRHIAADYGVDIFKLIKANNIPNPDSLRVGQELRIPDD